MDDDENGIVKLVSNIGGVVELKEDRIERHGGGGSRFNFGWS